MNQNASSGEHRGDKLDQNHVRDSLSQKTPAEGGRDYIRDLFSLSDKDFIHLVEDGLFNLTPISYIG
jgi:hypothetical protein